MTTSPPLVASKVRARPSGFLSDLTTVAGRALRAIPREPEAVLPALFIPTFFFVIYIGALQDLTEGANPNLDFKAFQLPVAIIFAVTGISRAAAVVTDINSGYFDRLLLTPARRLPLLLGLMVADFILVCTLCIPVILMGYIAGVRFETGIPGIVAFVIIGGLWGLAFTGFPYAIALKTGNAAAVNSSFLLFFPLSFLTTSIVPEEAMTGWLRTISTYNPITYVLGALRALISNGWEWQAIGQGLAAIAAVGFVAIGLALRALNGRVRRS